MEDLFMQRNYVPFSQADVFTQIPYQGNPVAVIIGGDKFSDDEMQKIANWTNLSETTFLCSPTNPAADYRLRIFTPKEELSFAGHPTIGSAKVALNNGLKPQHSEYLVQECAKGLVPVYMKQDKLFFALPEPEVKPISLDLLEAIAQAIGLQDSDSIKLAKVVDVGAVWYTLYLDTVETVLRLNPDDRQLASLLPKGTSGVTVFALTDGKTEVEVRSFAPGQGVHEDPVCGSGNGAVAVLVKEEHLLAKSHYLASQGQKCGRSGLIEVDLDNQGQILIGGQAVECIKGRITLPER